MKSDYHECQLTVEGYTVIPFFTPDEVERIKQIYEEGFGSAPENKHIGTTQIKDEERKEYMVRAVTEVYERGVKEWTTGVRTLGAGLLIKSGDERSMIHPHQDWNMVDERFYRSCNIWVPAIDTNRDNGAFCVMPRTHNLFLSYRGPNIDLQCRKIFPFLWENCVCIELKAGEAIVFDNRVFHGSDKNESGVVRLVSSACLIPEEAEEQLYYEVNINGKPAVEGFRTSTTYLKNTDRHIPPRFAPSLGVIDGYDLTPFTIDTFKESAYSYSGNNLMGIAAIDAKNKQRQLDPGNPKKYYPTF